MKPLFRASNRQLLVSLITKTKIHLLQTAWQGRLKPGAQATQFSNCFSYNFFTQLFREASTSHTSLQGRRGHLQSQKWQLSQLYRSLCTSTLMFLKTQSHCFQFLAANIQCTMGCLVGCLYHCWHLVWVEVKIDKLEFLGVWITLQHKVYLIILFLEIK